jgi:O-methyltransferase
MSDEQRQPVKQEIAAARRFHPHDQRISVGSLGAVDWRVAVNKGLRAATGYQIAKVPPAPPREARKRKALRRYYDDEARAIVTDVKPWTMTSYERLFGLVVAVRYIAHHAVPGAMVECGVWRGGSMQAVARTLLARDAADRELHLFDTFTGMPPPSSADRRIGGASAEELLSSGPRPGLVRAIADLDDVRAGMAGTGYPPERIHYHPGRVEDTIPGEAPEQIALLRLDTDWYESTKHELEHLYARVATGGVVIIDDYDYWEGSRKAVDEFVEATGARLLLVPLDTARIAVKPG